MLCYSNGEAFPRPVLATGFILDELKDGTYLADLDLRAVRRHPLPPVPQDVRSPVLWNVRLS